MKVTCKQTTSQGFDLKGVTTVSSNDFDYSYGGYGLQLDKEYFVMGVITYQDSNCLYYLVDVNRKPNWFPYLLFNLINNSIPKNWHIRINGRSDNTDIYSLCGFNELCNDSNFYDLLLESDEEIMRVYFKRKIELENGMV